MSKKLTFIEPRSYKQLLMWLSEIDATTDSDFCADMEMKTLTNSREYTQQEAREMAKTLASVYMWSHRIHCDACARPHNESVGQTPEHKISTTLR